MKLKHAFYAAAFLIAATFSLGFKSKPFSGKQCFYKITGTCVQSTTDQNITACETFFTGPQCTVTTAHVKYTAYELDWAHPCAIILHQLN